MDDTEEELTSLSNYPKLRDFIKSNILSTKKIFDVSYKKGSLNKSTGEFDLNLLFDKGKAVY